MRLLKLIIFATALALSAGEAMAQSVAGPTTKPLDARGEDFNPASSLESRIGAPAFFGPNSRQSVYTLTPEERRKVIAALDFLTPLEKRVAQAQVNAIVFHAGVDYNGSVVSLYRDDRHGALYDIVINPIVLSETVTQFLARKDRAGFEPDGSRISLSFEAGEMDAIVFVLLHEMAHVVRAVIGPPQVCGLDGQIAAYGTSMPVAWEFGGQLAEPYHAEILKRAMVGPSMMAKTIPISEAKAYYEALARTPLPSAYAAVNCGEDGADLVAWAHMTEVLKQPYRIEVRDGGKVVFAYEPMKNPLVRSRLPLVAPYNDSTYQAGK